MNLLDIRNAKLEGKRVLMRVDFNVPVKDGKIGERHRIKAAKETIDFVLSQKDVGVALLSHLGRPKDREEEFSFRNFYKEIGQILGHDMVFVDDCLGEKVKNAMEVLKTGQILMLENVRFFGPEENSGGKLAEELAANFDVFVNEAFGACHRNHASVVGVAGILPSFAGINLQKEVAELDRVGKIFEKPALAIIGGVKAETKLPVINFFAEKYDNVLVGGKIGLDAGKQIISFPLNVVLPRDYAEGGLDIGPETIKRYAGYIKRARTIVWNGPLGKFEQSRFVKGTEAVITEVVKNKEAYKVAGGGESVQFLEEYGLMEEFDFVSTGGGAMLDFLIKGTLPGLEALQSCTI